MRNLAINMSISEAPRQPLRARMFTVTVPIGSAAAGFMPASVMNWVKIVLVKMFIM